MLPHRWFILSFPMKTFIFNFSLKHLSCFISNSLSFCVRHSLEVKCLVKENSYFCLFVCCIHRVFSGKWTSQGKSEVLLITSVWSHCSWWTGKQNVESLYLKWWLTSWKAFHGLLNVFLFIILLTINFVKMCIFFTTHLFSYFTCLSKV